MRVARLVAVTAILWASMSPVASGDAPLAAFPGAAGSAATSKGGRGGRVIEVTNLNFEGPGSLREALDAKGPRIVVFRVAGVIDLARRPRIDIVSPYVTIAGQTAPGGGITITNSDIHILTHDVVIRYLRVRPNRIDGTPTHGLFVRENSANVMIDHCSLSWATDENFTVYAKDQPLQDVTFQWSISAEGLVGIAFNDHGAGAIVGSNERADLVRDIDFHHNFFAHNQFRNPYIKGASTQVINNIVYDWAQHAMQIRGGIAADIVGNAFRLGPNFVPSQWSTKSGVRHTSPGGNDGYGTVGDPSLFVEGNTDPANPNPDADNWPILVETTNDFQGPKPVDRRFYREVPLSRVYPVVPERATTLFARLGPKVGASARLDANGDWVSNRDAVDTRILRQYLQGTGIMPTSPEQVGGFPPMEAGVPYLDTDHDGMADVWEHKNAVTDATGDADGDGYTNIEEFLNGTNPRVPQRG